MLKQGDWLLSKIDYYEGDLIDNNGSLVGKRSIIGKIFDKRFFEKPHFKKGARYQIKNILTSMIPAGGTGGLYNSNISPHYYTYISYSIERSDKAWEQFSENDLKVLFYTPQEERALKLRKLNSI